MRTKDGLRHLKPTQFELKINFAPTKHWYAPEVLNGDKTFDPNDPYIVPPSLRKADYQQNLKPVWQAAASALGKAQNIIVCGFSLPATDEFFRYLYGLGSIGTGRIRRFWVIDPYADEALQTRFRSLLGGEALGRLEVFSAKFSQFCSKFAAGGKDVSWDQVAENLRKLNVSSS